MEEFTADVFSSKTFLVEGEVTYAVQGEFKATSQEDAEKQFRKRVREENTTHIKITSCKVKPTEKGWEGRPPGSPLRDRGPDMPLTPPPPARKKNTKTKPTP